MRKRVHVGAQGDRPVAAAARQRADDAGAADALGDLVSPNSRSFAATKADGALLLEAEFGMGVQIVPPRRHVTVQFFLIEFGHRHPLPFCGSLQQDIGGRHTDEFGVAAGSVAPSVLMTSTREPASRPSAVSHVRIDRGADQPGEPGAAALAGDDRGIAGRPGRASRFITATASSSSTVMKASATRDSTRQASGDGS